MKVLRSQSDLSSFIRIARQQRGWTQSELGDRAGLAEKHVNRIENGASEPRISSVMALLTALGHNLVAQEADLDKPVSQSVEDLF